MLAHAVLLAALLTGEDAASTHSGSGELGLVIARGNSATETLNAKLALRREGATWRHEAVLSALKSRQDGADSADRRELAVKSDFRRDQPRYGFLALRLEQDEFAAYRWQSSLAAGLGWRVLTEEGRRLALEAGPGLRRAARRRGIAGEGGTAEQDLILRASLDYRQRLSASAEFYEEALVESGRDNTHLKNDFGLRLKINDRLGLKASLAVRHNSSAPAGARRTDTLTSLNLAYDF